MIQSSMNFKEYFIKLINEIENAGGVYEGKIKEEKLNGEITNLSISLWKQEVKNLGE